MLEDRQEWRRVHNESSRSSSVSRSSESSRCSSVSVHNELLRRGRADLVETLAGGWWVDRKVIATFPSPRLQCSELWGATGIVLISDDKQRLSSPVNIFLSVGANQFCCLRQGEIPEGKPPYFRLPIFNYHNGCLSTSHNATYYGQA